MRREGEREGGRDGGNEGTKEGSHLLKSMFGLKVWVVACPDGPHGGGLISSVRLCGVFKVRVRPSWAVAA